MAADLEEVEAGASGAETGVAGRNAGPGAVSAAGAGMGATAGDPAGSSSAAAFPADPDFLAARDERRRRRSATAVSRCAAEGVPPWRTGTTSVILTMTLSMSLVQMILMLRQPKTNGGLPHSLERLHDRLRRSAARAGAPHGSGERARRATPPRCSMSRRLWWKRRPMLPGPPPMPNRWTCAICAACAPRGSSPKSPNPTPKTSWICSSTSPAWRRLAPSRSCPIPISSPCTTAPWRAAVPT